MSRRQGVVLPPLLAFLAGNAVSPWSVGAQAAQEIRRPQYCDCELRLEHVVDLGDTAGPGAFPGIVRSVHRSPDGRYYVLTWNEYLVTRFDSEGRALPPLGVEGEGPGETLDVATLEFVGDSVVLFDRDLRRITVFDERMTPVRTAAIPGRMERAVAVEGIGFVLNGRCPTRANAPLHVLASPGE